MTASTSRAVPGAIAFASTNQLLDRAGILEPRLLGPLPGLGAAPLRGPDNAMTAAAQDTPDRGSHLAGMQEANRGCSHYTGTLTIVWLGGHEMTQREQEFLDYVQSGGQVETDDWLP